MTYKGYKIGIILLLGVLGLEGLWGKALYQKMVYKNHRILVCISSFKRPLFATAQVYRLMRQTYPNFDISLSLKGVPQRLSEEVFIPELQPYINTGRVRVRIDKNRDQLSNLLDTVRDIDLDDYDYFCKVDDDDWYAPRYLEHVNEWLNKAYPKPAVSYTTSASIIQNGKKEATIFETSSSSLMGPTMCFSRDVIKAALDIEEHPQRIQNYIRDDKVFVQDYRYRREDALLHQLGAALGRQQNRRTSSSDVAFGQQFRSVMRNDNYVE